MTKCFDCGDGPCHMNCGPARAVAQIRTAYAVSNKGGMKTYRARAFVEDKGVKHTFIVALGDTPEEATQDALRYIRQRHEADNVPAPAVVKELGKMRSEFVDAYLF